MFENISGIKIDLKILVYCQMKLTFKQQTSMNIVSCTVGSDGRLVIIGGLIDGILANPRNSYSCRYKNVFFSCPVHTIDVLAAR